MSRKERKVIDRISGKGRIFKQKQLIGTAYYDITIKQEFMLTGKDRIPGLKEITGVIQVPENSFVIELGSELTLVLSDDREWTFFAKSGNPVNGRYECVNPPGSGIKSI